MHKHVSWLHSMLEFCFDNRMSSVGILVCRPRHLVVGRLFLSAMRRWALAWPRCQELQIWSGALAGSGSCLQQLGNFLEDLDKTLTSKIQIRKSIQCCGHLIHFDTTSRDGPDTVGSPDRKHCFRPFHWGRFREVITEELSDSQMCGAWGYGTPWDDWPRPWLFYSFSPFWSEGDLIFRHTQ